MNLNFELADMVSLNKSCVCFIYIENKVPTLYVGEIDSSELYDKAMFKYTAINIEPRTKNISFFNQSTLIYKHHFQDKKEWCILKIDEKTLDTFKKVKTYGDAVKIIGLIGEKINKKLITSKI